MHIGYKAYGKILKLINYWLLSSVNVCSALNKKRITWMGFLKVNQESAKYVVNLFVSGHDAALGFRSFQGNPKLWSNTLGRATQRCHCHHCQVLLRRYLIPRLHVRNKWNFPCCWAASLSLKNAENHAMYACWQSKDDMMIMIASQRHGHFLGVQSQHVYENLFSIMNHTS